MATARKRKPARSAAPRTKASRKPVLPKLLEGEVYAGITLHDDRLHHLIILPGDTELDWQAARHYAAKAGGTLPSRVDALVLFKNARKQFHGAAYWTDEQRADVAQYAWFQDFDWGDQDDDRQDVRLRVRAVRRVAI